MNDSLEKRETYEVAVAVLGQLFAAFMGFALGGPAAPFLIPALGPVGERLMQRVAAEWTNKSYVLADSALTESGLRDTEQFCETLTGDPHLIALMQRIAWAASMSGDRPKLAALGAILGRAVGSSGDRLEETQVMAAVLADLEMPHIVVLEILTHPAPDDEHHAGKANQEAAAADGVTSSLGGYRPPPRIEAGQHMSYEPGAWLPEHIQDEAPIDPDFALACVGVLVSHNLVSTLGTYGGGSRYKITRLGLALADVMRQTAEYAGPHGETDPPRSDAV